MPVGWHRGVRVGVERTERGLRRILTTFLVLFVVAKPLTAQAGLFDDAEPLAITLSFDLDALCRAGSDALCPDAQATLAYVDSEGTQHAVPVWIRARGKWRNVAANCSMPPLSVIFSEGGADGTLFAGQTMLPLTTHCNEHPLSQEQYVLKELLAYHIYNTLTDKSLRTRLARVTYEHTGRRPRTFERYAFFTEHFDSLAERNGAQFWPTENFELSMGDAAQIATVELFEFMIGNTDWSILKGHNIGHLRAADKSVVAVPYDFDSSGIVDASYATPPPNLRIRSVTQRVYRGFCHPGLGWETLFQLFEAKREPIEALVEQVPSLNEGERSEARAYVASFYEILGSAERRQKNIVDKCRPVADRS